MHPAARRRLERQHEEQIAAAKEGVSAAETTYGQDHPEVAAALARLGKLHQSMGEFDEADEALSRALALREKRAETEPEPHVQALRNLATLYDVCGRQEEARPLLQRAATAESSAFRSSMQPVESAEPEYNAHADFVEEMAGSAPKTPWTQIIGGVLLPLGLAAKGLTIVVKGRVAFYGARGSMIGDPLIVKGAPAVMMGLVWVCAAAFGYFHFFWPHRNRTLCSYGKAVSFIAAILLLLAALTMMWCS